jgi:hypothetical protein
MRTTWVIEPYLWDGHSEVMAKAAAIMGHDLVCTDILLEKPLPQIDGRVFVHGSFQLAKKVWAERPEWSPGVICKPENFVWSQYAPRIPKGIMLNPEWVVSTTNQLVEDERACKLEDCFIRPDAGTKPFGGTVFNGDRVTWLAMAKMFVRNAGDIPIIICPLKAIEAEYRLVVVEGKVVAGSQYMANDCIDIRPEYPEAATRIAQEAAEHYAPGVAFVVDVARTPAGYFVVEMNAFSTADWYGGDVQTILTAIGKAIWWQSHAQALGRLRLGEDCPVSLDSAFEVQHPVSVAGMSLKQLAKKLAGMRYDALSELLQHLSDQLTTDSLADANRLRLNLANELNRAALGVAVAQAHIEAAWKICEPHMRNSLTEAKGEAMLEELLDKAEAKEMREE